MSRSNTITCISIRYASITPYRSRYRSTTTWMTKKQSLIQWRDYDDLLQRHTLTKPMDGVTLLKEEMSLRQSLHELQIGMLWWLKGKSNIIKNQNILCNKTPIQYNLLKLQRECYRYTKQTLKQQWVPLVKWRSPDVNMPSESS